MPKWRQTEVELFIWKVLTHSHWMLFVFFRHHWQQHLVLLCWYFCCIIQKDIHNYILWKDITYSLSVPTQQRWANQEQIMWNTISSSRRRFVSYSQHSFVSILPDLQTTTPLNNVQLSKLLLSCSSFKSAFSKQGERNPLAFLTVR